MNWLGRDDSERALKASFRRDILLPGYLPNLFIGESGAVALVKPKICIHKAGIPEFGHAREQIMIQLNPCPKWKVRTDLYKKQHLREPSLPFLKNVFRGQIALEKLRDNVGLS